MASEPEEGCCILIGKKNNLTQCQKRNIWEVSYIWNCRNIWGEQQSKLIDQNNQPVLKDFNYGRDGLSHIADNSFNRYALQQNVYKFILEKHYDKKISSMNLLILHPNYTNYVHLKLPEMKKE